MAKSHLRIIRGRGEEHTKKRIKRIDVESVETGRKLKLISDITKAILPRNAVARVRQDLTGEEQESGESGYIDDTDSNDLLTEAISNVSGYVQNISREVHLYVDDTSGDPRVSVVDSSSGKTIRDIPQRELMTMSRHINAQVSDPIKGLIVKSKA